MSINNPYLNACQEWGERYGVCLYRVNNWRVITIPAPGLTGISITGVACIGAQSRVQEK